MAANLLELIQGTAIKEPSQVCRPPPLEFEPLARGESHMVCHVVTQVGSASAGTCAIVTKPATGKWNNSGGLTIQRQIKKKRIEAFGAKFPESVAGYTPVQVQRLYRTACDRKRTGKQAVCP